MRHQATENRVMHEHRLYPSMALQFEMANVGHRVLVGDWQCKDCQTWFSIESEDDVNATNWPDVRYTSKFRCIH